MILQRFLRFASVFLYVFFVCCGLAPAQVSTRSCEFDFAALAFKGTSLEQARCLLRKVKLGADLEDQTLPVSLEKLIDRDVSITKAALREFLGRKEIREDQIGGSLDTPISRGRSNSSTAPVARYFVIHDTSTPNLCAMTNFPEEINQSSWIFKGTKWNNPKISLYANSSNAHLYIMRDGNSTAPQGRMFNTPWRATKLEGRDVRSRGMFLHIENVQPRHCNNSLIASGKCIRNNNCNDNIAPGPGFSDAQLERLALVYIAASVRRGKWMVPAFHAAVDKGLSDGHDDPQNFDLQKWVDKICALITAMGATCPA